MRRDGLICILLALITLALYAPTFHHEFINLDDPTYVTVNLKVQSGFTKESMKWAFTEAYASNWHPLTWLSHMLDCKLYGLNPRGHHITNVAFHVANTVLLYWVMLGMTGARWRSAFVAALFGWHPMHVESVAWVAERKDVLSTFFWFLTMGAYALYVKELNAGPEQQGTRWKSKLYYGLALLAFALGLLSKPMLVTLPFVLVLLDFWPLRRIGGLPEPGTAAAKKGAERRAKGTSWKRIILEKVPFLLLAAGSSVATYLAQRSGGAVATLGVLPIEYRIANAVVSYLRYVQKIIWPEGLAIFYPHPRFWPSEVVLLCGVALVAISCGVVFAAKKRPYLAVGWFWFTGTLVPVIGLVQVGAQSMADRYTYVPAIGLFIIAAWGLQELAAKGPRQRWVVPALSAGGLAACLVATFVQLQYWKNSLTICQRAISVTSNNTTALVNGAAALIAEGRIDEGVDWLKRSLAIDPDQGAANSSIALALGGQGKAREALPYYRKAVILMPNMPTLLNNLAWILAANADAEVRNGPEAVETAERACKLTNYQVPLLIGTLAAAKAEAGRFPEAIEAANQACKLAESLGQTRVVEKNRELLELYKANKAYHEPAQ
ncbi:MAG: Tetratricopeptide 2 repeat protein [Pedosphaera sp.]|nr:Tetratricopeptide 2 repeat protein [Pedosphaera sp.]